MKQLITIDAYGFVFRAYYSLASMTTINNQPIGALFGFCNMILKILKDFQPQNILIIFDSGQKNFRHILNEEYKNNRTDAPPELISQFKLIREFVEYMGLASWEAIGFEADDLIATIAKKCLNEKKHNLIISADKDLMQLVNDDYIVMYDPTKDKYIRSAQVKEKFNIMPEKVLDFLTLMGDKSDNIQGVYGIGPKTAAKLINEFDNLENILANISKISSKKIANNLEVSKNYIFNSRDLIRLADNVPLPQEDLEQWSNIKAPNFTQLFQFLKQYDFSSLIQRIEKIYNKKHQDYQKQTTKEEIILNDEHDLQQILKTFQYNLQIFFDFQDSQCLMAFQNLQIFIINYKKIPNFIHILESILINPAIRKIFLDSKRNMHFLKRYDINIQNSYDDLLSLYYSTAGGQFLPNAENLQKKFIINSELPYYFYIFEILEKNLLELHNKKTLEIYQIEKNICKILFDMENHGVSVDNEILNNLAAVFIQKKQNLEKEIFAISGQEFNLNSPKQISEIIFDKLKLPEVKKNKSGNFTTDYDTLSHLKINGHEIAEKILQWRHFDKLINTYIKGLQKYLDQQHIIHTNYSNFQTITGRLISNQPNLQNLPIKSIDGKAIREAFIIPDIKQHIFISADYSQIELRIAAELAQVKKLQDAFRENLDIHAITAMEIFEIDDIKAVTSEQRQKAKTINFGILYGLSPFSLAKNLNISLESAKFYIEKYFQQYPEIQEYIEQTIQNAEKVGFVKTMLGRIIHIKDINNINHNIRHRAQRSAINAPIQGTAADIIKIAMIKISNNLDPASLKMIMQIHDELIFISNQENLHNNLKLIENNMQNIMQINKLKLIVNMKTGHNLLKMQS